MLGHAIIVITWVFTFLAIVTVALRIYVRTNMKTGLGWDDWIMLIAVVSTSHIHQHARELY